MAPPPKRRRKRAPTKVQAEELPDGDDTAEPKNDVDDHELVGEIEVLHNKAPTKPRGRHIIHHDPLSALFQVNETFSKYGVSENIRWGASIIARPSQFEDEHAVSCQSQSKSMIKRRHAITDDNEYTNGPEANSIVVTATKILPPQVLTFTDPELYSIWRAVSPSPREAPARTRIKWSELRRALTSPPLSFTEDRIAGVECKFKREAMAGYDEGMVPLHQPHGKDGWLGKELLWVTKGPFRHTFGWEADCFALEG